MTPLGESLLNNIKHTRCMINRTVEIHNKERKQCDGKIKGPLHTMLLCYFVH